LNDSKARGWQKGPVCWGPSTVYGVCAHFPKNTALNPAQAKFHVSNAGFCELQKTQKINLRGIKGDGFPTRKLSFCAFFHIFHKYFMKKCKKNALDIIRVKRVCLCFLKEFVFLKTHRLHKISFLNSNFFSDFSWGVTPFCKNSGS